jgi:hypothetical protein
MVRFILSSLRYLGPATFVVAVVALALPACDQGRQGDRCNPELIQDSSAANGINGGAYNEDECNSGLTCQMPPTCVISVCCPTSPPYSDPNCACLAAIPPGGCPCSLPSLLPSEDAGEDSGEDSGTDSGSDSAASDSGGPDSGGTDSGGLVDSGGDATDAANPTDGPTE